MENTVFFLILALLLGGSPQSRREQKHFSAEDDSVQSPASLPASILNLLAQDEDLKELLADEKLEIGRVAKAWFMSSIVHLRKSDQRDIVVIGQGPILGANVTTFWVFRSVGNEYRLVLNAPAHDLVIKNSRTNDYLDIEIIAATVDRVSTTTFKFDGTKYEPASTKTERIR